MLFLSCPLCSVFCWHCLDVYCTETAIYGTLALKQTPPVNTHCVTDIQSHNHVHASTQYNISCYRTMSAWLTIKTQLQSAVLYDAFTCTLVERLLYAIKLHVCEVVCRNESSATGFSRHHVALLPKVSRLQIHSIN